MSFSQQKSSDTSIEKTNDLLKQGLRDMNQANEITDQTQKKLYEQNEKLDKAIDNIDKSQQSINNSQYIARGMKSFWGQLVNLFTKPKAVEQDADLEKIRQKQQQSAQNTESNNVGSTKSQQQEKSQISKSQIEQQNDLLDEINSNVSKYQKYFKLFNIIVNKRLNCFYKNKLQQEKNQKIKNRN
ncbi:hypothetical protein TTHERM_00526630 (macronuclear) [Tetrahymena thermophila SB210]|uniref:t-SNARE coiled-coil homology domain-containing protein n=1 Tax=Tetrahymena thermophila (strain SB210) TaxID=312017 RepID=I7MN35_TETTS|nr:hypothetical protein TTHERM_00526630 [Tetrahymena thermophila SB210]EAS07832.2 hypothetical protein TTHERM_00526630 [Tetrahymena thermophila SB210]|eukprot:XP_001028074.2 hypothetical protein TTHERM_00526630 [Tetrahymena thermophila SB210]